MKLINSNYEIIEPVDYSLENLYKFVELCGRVCYKSEDKITSDSATKFVDRLIKSGHCYTGDTEILTENGWIKFRDYNGEKVAVINKDCSFKGFENPKRIVNYSYKGNFYYYPSLGIEVTDGHNMFGVFRESKNNFYKNDSYSLFKCNEYYKDNNGREKTLGERMFKTPRHCLKSKSLNPYGELIGFWLGDGCYSPETKNKLIFHLKKQRKIEYLKQLCEELGYIFEERKSNYYTVTNDNIGSSFNSLFYNNGKRISLQYFPSIDIAYSIINGLINSDGSLGINTKTITFSNISKSIIDWLLMYAPICGYSISNRGISNNTTLNNPVYKVLLLDTDYTLNNDSRNKDSKVIITNKVEEVYCVTVSTGLIMVRGTNGITTICGNCSVLEHGTVYLKLHLESPVIANKKSFEDSTYRIEYDKFASLYKFIFDTFDRNPYSVVNKQYDKLGEERMYITTNLRVLYENALLDELKPYFCTQPEDSHERRYTVRFIMDRIGSQSFCRHRHFSFSQESTRYCDYSKDKFKKEVTYIIPTWLDIPEGNYTYWDGDWVDMDKLKINVHDEDKVSSFLFALDHCEKMYKSLKNKGCSAQEARQVLPNALKTELIMTGFTYQWEGFFGLRDDKKAHPDAYKLAHDLHNEFKRRNYVYGETNNKE